MLGISGNRKKYKTSALLPQTTYNLTVLKRYVQVKSLNVRKTLL